MRVLDLLTRPWAIRPEVLQTMLDIYERHARGEKPDLKAIEAEIGRPLRNEAQHDFSVNRGVAVIPIQGVIGKHMDLFLEISGGTSTVRVQEQLRAALADPAIHSIVLAIDSPGGQVDGVQALASDVFAARQKKPVAALGDGVMASGAYWIGSAASRVYITGDTVAVGSIGVVATHTDVSRAQEMRGVKTTEITAGKYKRIASNYAPLTPEGRQSIQEVVDHVYSVFVDDVARNRGVSNDQGLSMADGKLFMGKKAQEAGLVDGFATLDNLVTELNAPGTPTLQAPSPVITKSALGEEGPIARMARIEAEAAKYVPPPVVITPVELLKPSPKPDPSQVAARARTIKRLLDAHKFPISTEEACRVAEAENSRDLRDPAVVSVLARIEICAAREKGIRFRDELPLDEAVALVLERYAAA